MTLRNFLPLVCATALLAACNSSQETVTEEETGPVPLPELTAAPAPTAAPDGTAIATGSWNVGEDANGARATFGEPGSPAELTIACDTVSRIVSLTRSSAAAGPQSFAIAAGGQIARLDMTPVAGATSAMTAEIDPTLAIFAAFSQADAVIAFTSQDGATVQYPTHPGIQRVIYACL